MDYRICPNCGRKLNAEAKFCGGCGTKLPPLSDGPSCPNCGKAVRPGAKFCGSCGGSLEEVVVKRQENICPNCGKTVKEGAKFCGTCGTSISVFPAIDLEEERRRQEELERIRMEEEARILREQEAERNRLEAEAERQRLLKKAEEEAEAERLRLEQEAAEKAAMEETEVTTIGETIICNNCGNEVSAGETICTNCGADIVVDTVDISNDEKDEETFRTEEVVEQELTVQQIELAIRIKILEEYKLQIEAEIQRLKNER